MTSSRPRSSLSVVVLSGESPSPSRPVVAAALAIVTLPLVPIAAPSSSLAPAVVPLREVSSLVGDGTAGREWGSAAESRLSQPHDAVMVNGELFVSETGAIRRVDPVDGSTVPFDGGDTSGCTASETLAETRVGAWASSLATDGTTNEQGEDVLVERTVSEVTMSVAGSPIYTFARITSVVTTPIVVVMP